MMDFSSGAESPRVSNDCKRKGNQGAKVVDSSRTPTIQNCLLVATSSKSTRLCPLFRHFLVDEIQQVLAILPASTMVRALQMEV